MSTMIACSLLRTSARGGLEQMETGVRTFYFVFAI